MAKKNPYVFTIGFDETDLSHVRAAEILNGTKKKAQLIAAAILSYVDGVNSERASEFTPETFQPLLEKLIRREMEKIMEGQKALEDIEEKTSEKILDLTLEEDEAPIDENLTQNLVNAMDAFRRV